MDEKRRKFLQDKRTVIMDRLRRVQPELIRELAVIDAELEGLELARSQKYSRYRAAHEAITAYLKEVGRPRPWDEIIVNVVAGGFFRGTRDPVSVVRDSIEYHVVRHPPELRKRFKPFGKPEDKILGLWEWPDTMTPEG